MCVLCLALCFDCFSRPPAALLSVRSRLVCVSPLAVGCSLVLPPPPPCSFVSRGFRCSCLLPWCFSRPPAAWLSVRSRLVYVSPLAVGCSLVLPPPPPPLLCLAVFVAPAGCLGAFFFIFLPLCAPVVSGFLWFPTPGALGLGAVRCLPCWPSASRRSLPSSAGNKVRRTCLTHDALID